MKLAMMLPPVNEGGKWELAAQMGVRRAITKAAPELSGCEPPSEFESLALTKKHFAAAGLELCALEGDQFDMSPIKLGLSDRDECIEKYRRMLRNMGALGIPLLCLNFMASIGWFRTRSDIRERGGALTTSFDADDIGGRLVEERLRIGEKKLWENLFYFLDAVLPVAEESGVMLGLHPDDPPISPLMGVARILTSVENYEKIFARYKSLNIGATFCQATFKAMGADIRAVSADWIARKKIFFIHIRDIDGDARHFREVFVDSQKNFTADMLAHYDRCGFNGVIRSDHAPAMGGEIQDGFNGGISAGYQSFGHIYATGYIKGCCDAAKIPLQ